MLQLVESHGNNGRDQAFRSFPHTDSFWVLTCPEFPVPTFGTHWELYPNRKLSPQTAPVPSLGDQVRRHGGQRSSQSCCRKLRAHRASCGCQVSTGSPILLFHDMSSELGIFLDFDLYYSHHTHARLT